MRLIAQFLLLGNALILILSLESEDVVVVEKNRLLLENDETWEDEVVMSPIRTNIDALDSDSNDDSSSSSGSTFSNNDNDDDDDRNGIVNSYENENDNLKDEEEDFVPKDTHEAANSSSDNYYYDDDTIDESISIDEKKNESVITSVLASNLKEEIETFTTEVRHPKDENKTPEILVNYAHKNSGAIILSSSKGLDGVSNILVSDRDKYAIAPCELLAQKLWVIVALPEDILVKSISIANYERYSSNIKTFQILASTQIPIKEEDNISGDGTSLTADPNSIWTDLGTYQTVSSSGRSTNKEDMFDIMKPAWARYVKIVFLNHDGVEFYCTVSQVKVHGSTMVQGFHEEYMKEKEALGIDDEDDEEEVDEYNIDIITSEEPIDKHSTKEENSNLHTDPQNRETNKNLSALDPVASLEISANGDVMIQDSSRITAASKEKEGTDPIQSDNIAVVNDLSKNTKSSESDQKDIEEVHVDIGEASDDFGDHIEMNEPETQTVVKNNISADHVNTINKIDNASDEKASITNVHEIDSHVSDVDLVRNTSSNVATNSTLPHYVQNPASVTTSAKHDYVKAKLSSESQPTNKVIKESDTINQGAHIAIPNTFDSSYNRKYSSCLESLNYAIFKEAKRNKAMQKQKQKDAKAEQAVSGSAFPMEPIFKTLSNDIKAMMINQTIFDQYLIQVNNCYQTIILSMERDMSDREKEFRARLNIIEEKQRTSFKEVAVLSLSIVTISLCCLFSLSVCLRYRGKPTDYIDLPSEENEARTPLNRGLGWNPYNSIARGNSRTSPGEPDRSAGGSSTRDEILNNSAPFFPEAETLTI